MRGKDKTIAGIGLRTRTFCYLADLVDALLQLVGSQPDSNGVINMENLDGIAVPGLARPVIRLTGGKSKLKCTLICRMFRSRARPDISVVRTTLKWELQVNLKCGLLNSFAGFQIIS